MGALQDKSGEAAAVRAGGLWRVPSAARERRHYLAREQIDGAQHLGAREVAERELGDEVVCARLLHLRLDHARDGRGRARDAAPAVLDLVEVRRPVASGRTGAVLAEEVVEMAVPQRIGAARDGERLVVGR